MKKYLAVIAIIFVILIIQNLQLSDSGKNPEITRPDYDGENFTMNIDAVINGEKVPVSVDVAPVELTPEGALELFKRVSMEIELLVPDNADSDLEPPTKVDGVEIFWISSDEKLIAADGTLHPYELEQGQEKDVKLTAVLSLGEYHFERDFEVTVVCPPIDSFERKLMWINSRVKKYLDENMCEQNLILPANIEGMDIDYELPSDSGPGVFVIIFAGITAILLARHLDMKNKEKIKIRQMEIDYCEVVSKLVLLLGAGLTIRNAWEKTVSDYQAKKKTSGERVVYEEMSVTLNELAAGVPERLVYENFGKRCGLPRYIKLGSLLQQNFIKGSRQLLRLLEEESDRAFEDRKLLAKKQGEEAGTKLLFPMLLELIVVMAIVMVPALMSF
ncbi:MAG: immunoglobulin-like domain-containing protein [Lachnospiraceae bacterium]